MDDGPLDRIHQLVPPLEVTATAGVCVGLFAIGRMIFRAPIAMTILGGLALQTRKADVETGRENRPKTARHLMAAHSR